eukprot:10556565-Karenia_brevis.AAC.1
MGQLQQQVADLTTENQRVRAEMAQEQQNRTDREATFRSEVDHRAAAATAAASSGGVAMGQSGVATGSDGQYGGAMVAKWAPDAFDGTQEAWRSFSLKFRSYVGAMAKGQTGVWMDFVSTNRETSAKIAVLDPRATVSAAILWSALIAVCEGKSLTVIERAGEGEGLEAWRLLLGKYDVQTRQTKVIRMIQVLNWDFMSGDLMDRLEAFDLAVSKY